MPITIICAGCDKKLKVPESVMGKKIRCPACKSVIDVPEGDNEPVEPDAEVAVTKSVPPPIPRKAASDDEPRSKRKRRDADDEDDGDDVGPRRKKRRDEYDDDVDDDDGERFDVRRTRRSDRAYALSRTAGPGISLMICGIVGTVGFMISAILNLIGLAAGPQVQVGPDRPPAYLVGQICGMAFMITINAVIGFGGYQIKTLTNYRNAKAVSIVAMIPGCSPCYLLGIPFAIWALVVLTDKRVKRAFTS